MTFSGIDSIVLLIAVALLGASVATATILLRKTAEKRHKEMQAVSAATKLQGWRDSGLLVMTDEDFQFALGLEKHSPGQLHRLTRMIHRVIEEKDLKPDEYIRLTAQVEYDDEPEVAPGSEPRKGHLELIAEFA